MSDPWRAYVKPLGDYPLDTRKQMPILTPYILNLLLVCIISGTNANKNEIVIIFENNALCY